MSKKVTSKIEYSKKKRFRMLRQKPTQILS